MKTGNKCGMLIILIGQASDKTQITPVCCLGILGHHDFHDFKCQYQTPSFSTSWHHRGLYRYYYLFNTQQLMRNAPLHMLSTTVSSCITTRPVFFVNNTQPILFMILESCSLALLYFIISYNRVFCYM